MVCKPIYYPSYGKPVIKVFITTTIQCITKIILYINQIKIIFYNRKLVQRMKLLPAISKL